jgi:cytidylate kinase
MKISKEIPFERLVSRQVRLWDYTHEEIKRRQSEQPVSCITISREMGSQGSELAHSLANRLNWHLFDKELIELIAENAHVRNSMVESFDEKTQNEMQIWVTTLLSHHILGAGKFQHCLFTTILSMAEKGEAVILGRGGNFILPPYKALRLKVIMPLQNRIDKVAKQKDLTRKAAARLIADVDKARVAFIRRFFHHDAMDPLYYDLVLNMGTLDLETAEEIVVHTLETKSKLILKTNKDIKAPETRSD